MPSSRRTASRRLRATLAFVVALAACRDGSGTDEVTTLTATGAVEGVPRTTIDPDGAGYLACDASYQVRVEGGGARWTGAVIRYYGGLRRGTPFDSSTFTAEQVAAAFASPVAVSRGTTLNATWQVGGGAPFFFDLELRYVPDGGGERRTVTPLRCGPALPGGNFSANIEFLGINTPAGDLAAGDVVEVRLLASSPGTIWQTELVLDGPCRLRAVHDERFSVTVNRTARLTLPADCALGVPFTASAAVVDGAGGVTRRTVSSEVRLGDVTPPQLAPVFAGAETGSPNWYPEGTWIAGDTLRVSSGIQDAGGLAWLVWELQPSGRRDSVAISGTASGARIPMDAAWLGLTGLQLVARDARGNASAPVVVDVRAMRVLPAAPVTVRSATIPGAVPHVVVDPVHDLVWVAGDFRARAIARTTGQETRTIALPHPATGLDVTPSGDTLLLTFAASRSVGVVDLRASEPTVVQLPVSTIDPAYYTPLVGVWMMANGTVLLRVTGAIGAARGIHEIDLATGVARQRTDIALTAPTHVARSLDRRVLVLGDQGPPREWQRYTAATNAFAGPVAVGAALGLPHLDGTGAHLTLGGEVYDGTFALLRPFERPSSAPVTSTVALSADGTTAHLMLPGARVLRARVSDGRLVDGFLVPGPAVVASGWPGSSRMVFVTSTLGAPTSTVTIVE